MEKLKDTKRFKEWLKKIKDNKEKKDEQLQVLDKKSIILYNRKCR